ncbi:MAG: flavin-containing monooxygenase, partial [Kordiimonas sp.]
TIYEKADRVGGTWRDNTYPGVACDVPSHLYSFSFAPKHDWTRAYSPGAEIQEYCQAVADEYGLGDYLHFVHTLEHSELKEGKWYLTFSNGKQIEADYLISCIGGLHIPSYPSIEGRAAFKGKAFHSAEWDHSYDLSGKKVAVIGTAASALQLIPEIVEKVKHLNVYQRTANWVMPREEKIYSEALKKQFGRWPILAKLLRLWIYILHEMRVPLFRGNSFFQKRAEAMAKKHLDGQVTNHCLREKLTPNYPIGCKRILASDRYFPALQRENVTLHTNQIRRILPQGIEMHNGDVHEVEAIIYATGFKPFDIADKLEVTGKDGLQLSHYMQDGIRAHRSVAVPGFPNYFMLLGPNSGLGHNSIILIIEAQADYILQAINYVTKTSRKTVNVKKEVADAFNADLQKQLKDTIWSSSNCRSWYQDADGRIFTLWPKGTVSFKRALSKFDPDEYLIE